MPRVKPELQRVSETRDKDVDHFAQDACELESKLLKWGNIGDDIGDYYRGN